MISIYYNVVVAINWIGFSNYGILCLSSTETLQRTDLCLESFDDGPPFVIDLPNR